MFGKISVFIDRQPERLIYLEIFILSLLVRLIYLYIAGWNEIRINNDEVGYFYQGLAFADIIKGYQSTQIIGFFYSDGYWPPLHPMILGLTIAIFGSEIFVCRFATILIGALTSLMLFKTSRLFFNKNKSLITSFVHVFHPSFIAFSIALWSETTFAFFLICTIYFLLILLTKKNLSEKKQVITILLAGVMLGLCGLSRAVTVTLLPVILVFLIIKFKSFKSRIVYPLVLVFTTLLVWSPWMIYASKKEGKPVLLSTQLAYNLALGNNLQLPEGFSSSLDDPDSKLLLSGEITRSSLADSLSDDAASMKVAKDTITEDPLGSIKRTITRGKLLLSLDYITLRALLALQYNEMPLVLAAVMVFTFIIVHILYLSLFLFACIKGFGKNLWIRIILFLVIFSLGAPLITVASPRHAIAALVISCPLVVFGLFELRSMRKRPDYIWAGVSLLVVLILTFSALPILTRNYLKPSSYYLPILNPVAKLFNFQLNYVDNFHVIMKKNLGEFGDMKVMLLESGSEEAKSRTLFASAPTIIPIERSSNSEAPVLKIDDSNGYEEIIPLVDKNVEYGQWSKTGLPGLLYKWDYSGADTQLLLRKYLTSLKRGKRLNQK